MGRQSNVKTWLKPDALQQLETWAADGMSDNNIAAAMGVSRSSLSRYKNDNDAIDTAIKKGRQLRRVLIANTAEDALYKRLNGYYVTETTTETITAADGTTTTKTTEKSRYIQPSDTCMIFALKKLLPTVYGDNPTSEDDENVMSWHDSLVDAIKNMTV